MVSTNEAMAILKEAQGVERNLGASWYRPVKNTATGNNVMEHVLTVGMPGANTGWSVSQNNALASLGIGALGTTSLALAFTNFEKSQNGGAEANKRQRKRALGQLIGAGICFAILSPGTYQWPLQGSPGGSTPKITRGPFINNSAIY